MKQSDDALQARLAVPAFPRSAKYPARWMLENAMGPNPIWLAEALAEVLPLEAGMRVLDLGCGRAITSIFLAREFDVAVWACDLWIKPTENWQRIQDAGLEKQVFPVRGEAHELPFADGFFDALVSLDAYHYFGTDDSYLGHHHAPLVKAGGQIGIVVPGLVEEFKGEPPAHLAPHWAKFWEFWTFHSPAWWRSHWAKTGLVEVEIADLVPNGWEHWVTWDEASLEYGFVPEHFAADLPSWIGAIKKDAGRNVGFTRVVARKPVDGAGRL